MMLPKALKDVAVTAAIKVASENPNLSNNSIAKNVTLKKSLRNYINIILYQNHNSSFRACMHVQLKTKTFVRSIGP